MIGNTADDETNGDDMKKIAELIAEQGLTMTCEYTDTNPNMDNADNMSHWKCRIKRGRKQLTIIFSMGAAHTGKPDLASVLECMASDANSIENVRGFEDWCGDYGYDTDSRKAERTFKACERERDKLRNLLGPAIYQVLLYETERM